MIEKHILQKSTTIKVTVKGDNIFKVRQRAPEIYKVKIGGMSVTGGTSDIPAGGATGTVLTKTSPSDFTMSWILPVDWTNTTLTLHTTGAGWFDGLLYAGGPVVANDTLFVGTDLTVIGHASIGDYLDVGGALSVDGNLDATNGYFGLGGGTIQFDGSEFVFSHPLDVSEMFPDTTGMYPDFYLSPELDESIIWRKMNHIYGVSTLFYDDYHTVENEMLDGKDILAFISTDNSLALSVGRISGRVTVDITGGGIGAIPNPFHRDRFIADEGTPEDFTFSTPTGGIDFPNNGNGLRFTGGSLAFTGFGGVISSALSFTGSFQTENNIGIGGANSNAGTIAYLFMKGAGSSSSLQFDGVEFLFDDPVSQINILPNQIGHSSQVLMTDGTVATWQELDFGDEFFNGYIQINTDQEPYTRIRFHDDMPDNDVGDGPGGTGTDRDIAFFSAGALDWFLINTNLKVMGTLSINHITSYSDLEKHAVQINDVVFDDDRVYFSDNIECGDSRLSRTENRLILNEIDHQSLHDGQQANIFINGFGEFGDITGWETYAPSQEPTTNYLYKAGDAPVGYGSFQTGYNGYITLYEKYHIDPTKTYSLSCYMRTDSSISQTHRIAIVCYDVDGNEIEPQNATIFPGSEATLAQTLNNGDSTMYINGDTDDWYQGSEVHLKRFGFFNYENNDGYTYPDYTYTRNESGADAWDELVSGMVSMPAGGWDGGTYLVGTRVANTLGGDTHEYPIRAEVPSTENDWVFYSGSFSPRNGTAYVRMEIHSNLNGSSYLSIAGLSLTEASSTPTSGASQYDYLGVDENGDTIWYPPSFIHSIKRLNSAGDTIMGEEDLDPLGGKGSIRFWSDDDTVRYSLAADSFNNIDVNMTAVSAALEEPYIFYKYVTFDEAHDQIGDNGAIIITDSFMDIRTDNNLNGLNQGIRFNLNDGTNHGSIYGTANEFVLKTSVPAMPIRLKTADVKIGSLNNNDGIAVVNIIPEVFDGVTGLDRSLSFDVDGVMTWNGSFLVNKTVTIDESLTVNGIIKAVGAIAQFDKGFACDPGMMEDDDQGPETYIEATFGKSPAAYPTHDEASLRFYPDPDAEVFGYFEFNRRLKLLGGNFAGNIEVSDPLVPTSSATLSFVDTIGLGIDQDTEIAGDLEVTGALTFGTIQAHNHVASQVTDFDAEVSNNTDVDANTTARHAESHTVASHSDTSATGAELDELTDGSETALHSHAGGGTGDVVGPAGAVDGNIVAFDLATGKLVKDSGVPYTDIGFNTTHRGSDGKDHSDVVLNNTHRALGPEHIDWSDSGNTGNLYSTNVFAVTDVEAGNSIKGETFFLNPGGTSPGITNFYFRGATADTDGLIYFLHGTDEFTVNKPWNVSGTMKATTVKTDDVVESTADAGVTIDGLDIKDGDIPALITGQTEETSPTSDDFVLIYENTGAGHRKVALSNLPTGSAIYADESGAVVADVWNVSGAAITAGSPVFISGYNIGSDLVEIEEADATAAATMPALGLVRADISNGSGGIVDVMGSLNNMDTSGWSVGDPLYVSETTGTLTNTRPTGATVEVQKMGLVLRSHATLGIIGIIGAGRTNDVPNIAEGSFWQGDSDGVASEVSLDEAIQVQMELTVGEEIQYVAPFSMTITGWTMLLDVSGSAAIDVWKDTYANHPPVDADSLVTPSVTTAAKNQATSLTLTVTKGDCLIFHVDSATTATLATLVLTGVRT